MKNQKYNCFLSSSTLVAAVAIALSCVMPARAESVGDETVEKTPNPILTFQTLDIGTKSGLNRPAKMMIVDEAEWKRVWKIHTTGQEFALSAPPVDWENKAVVALMLGEQSPNSGIEVRQIARNRNETVVYYFQTRGARDGKNVAQPFHFVVVDKPQTPVRFADANTECVVCVVR
ncbi:MAG TPA: hypothetical protein VF719_00085 [Abditibacteriaceae bacterium]|jgi:hypothetical protein